MASIFVEAEAEAVLPLIRELFPRWYVDTHPTPTNTLLYFFFVGLHSTPAPHILDLCLMLRDFV